MYEPAICLSLTPVRPTICEDEDAIMRYMRRYGTAAITGALRPAADQLTAQGQLREVRNSRGYSHHEIAA